MVAPVAGPAPASPPRYSLKMTDRVMGTISALEVNLPVISQKINSAIRSLYKQPFPVGTISEETEVGVIFTYQIKEVKYEITYSVRGEVIQILRVDQYVAEI